jgi:GT2 family glycosyltransferase
MPKKVDIIVVNWNAGEKTLQAVTPYLQYNSLVISCHVIVVDNASVDDSVNILAGRQIELIQNNKNVGFSKACNQALRMSSADYILLLNPDTTSTVDVLEALVQFLEANPAYAMAGPSQLDTNRNLLRTCARFPTFKTSLFDVLGLSKAFPKYFTPAPIMADWDHRTSKEVDHVMGSYMLIRKPVLEKVGYMDEGYFVYFEDLDLSKRCSDAGFKTFYHNKHSILHEAGGTGHKAESERLFYSLSSRYVYWRKHFNKISSLLLTTLSLTVEPFLRLVDSLIKEKEPAFKKIGNAYSRYYKKIRNTRSQQPQLE